MALRAQKKSAIDRRLKELEKQAALVRGDIKTLSKAIRKPDSLEALPRLKSRDMEAVPPPTRKDPVQMREAMKAEQAPVEEESSPAQPEPAPDAGQAEGGRTKRIPPVLIPASEAEKEAASKHKTVMNDDRFANYFSSGSFLGGGGLRQEKNVQRNKAIFMVVIVVVVAFSVFRLWFR
jgi:hypothetical protein